MSDEERVIIECHHCGAMYDVKASELICDRAFRCRRCRKSFEARRAAPEEMFDPAPDQR